MNTVRRLCLTTVLMTSAIILARPANANDLHVPRDHPTIQDAIDAASPGDRIRVRPGSYGPITVGKENLTILSWRGRSVIEGTGGDVVTITANGVTLRGFEVRGGLRGIGLQADDGRIEHNEIHDCVVGIEVDGDRSLILGNRCHDSLHGIVLFLFAAENRIVSNECRDNEARGFVAILGTSNLWIGNCARGNGQGFLIQSGTIDGVGDVLFANIARDNVEYGFATQNGRGNSWIGNWSANNGAEGFWVQEALATDNTFRRNWAIGNGTYGFSDATTGDGTAGTANVYFGNRCHGSGIAPSDPEGLCR